MGFWDFLSTQSGGVLIGGFVSLCASLGGMWLQGRKDLRLFQEKQRQESVKWKYEYELAFYNEMKNAISIFLASINMDTFTKTANFARDATSWVKTLSEMQSRSQQIFLFCNSELRFEIENLQNYLLNLPSNKKDILERLSDISEQHKKIEGLAREYLDAIRPAPPVC